MKRIVIMGASSGIGYAMARALVERGVRVGVAARHTQTLRELKKQYPDLVEYAEIDVSKPEAVGRFEKLIKALGGMDIYFHVAGIGFENISLEPEREVEIIKTNCAGFARMLCAAYRWMRGHGVRGRIAAVTSVAGTNGMDRLSAYSSSKRFGQTYMVALEQLARAEKSGISFTDIRPGWVNTPLLAKGVKYPMEMTLDHVVPLILKAILRGRRVAVIDWRWNVVVGLWRMIPNCLWTRMRIKISEPDIPLPAPGKNAPIVGGHDV